MSSTAEQMWDTRRTGDVWEATRNRWRVQRALRRLALTDPEIPKLPVYFADGPFRHVTYVALRDEPETRLECSRARGHLVDEDGRVREIDLEHFTYVYVGMRDGCATYELEVAE